MSTLGGSVCIRNGNKLDFPWKQAVQSLLPVCDEVCICVGSDNEDETEWEARAWVATEPKLNLCIYPWPEPKHDPDFWVTWLNYAREHLKSEWHFQLDADEVLHERSYPELRAFVDAGKNRTGHVTRWNFWRDHQHTIPEGVCLGKHVIRIAPSNIWLPSDGYHVKGVEAANISEGTGIEIFHYGFIRKPAAFFQKERLLQGYFFGGYDSRLEAAEKFDGNWMTMPDVTGWESKLDDHPGDHPAVMREWLAERGYGL